VISTYSSIETSPCTKVFRVYSGIDTVNLETSNVLLEQLGKNHFVPYGIFGNCSKGNPVGTLHLIAGLFLVKLGLMQGGHTCNGSP